MNFIRVIVLIIGSVLVSLSITGCAGAGRSTRSLIAEPPKDEAFRAEPKKELSNLNITLETAARDLASSLDKLTPRDLYKGASSARGISVALLRNGPIGITAADDYVYLTLPVSMTLAADLGFGSFAAPALTPTLKFKIALKASPDWRINTEIYYQGLSDRMAEELKVGPLVIKPRNLLDGVTEPVQKILSDQISRKINEKFPLKKEVSKVWAIAQKPIAVDRKYSAWLKLTPREVLFYPLYARNNTIRFCLGLRSVAELSVGPEPAVGPLMPLPDLTLANGANRTFRVALNTDVYYSDLLAIARPLLLDKELGDGGHSLVLKDLDLYGNGEHLIIKAVAKGSFEGTFYLTCRPVFDPQSNRFSVEDVDFDMQTRSLLLNSADWLLHGVISSQIRDKLNMDLTQKLEQAREMAAKSLSQIKLSDNILLTGSVAAMKLNDVAVRRDKLTVQLYAEGETTITYR